MILDDDNLEKIQTNVKIGRGYCNFDVSYLKYHSFAFVFTRDEYKCL